MGVTIHYSYYFKGKETELVKRLRAFEERTGIGIQKNVLFFEDLDDYLRFKLSMTFASFVEMKLGLDGFFEDFKKKLKAKVNVEDFTLAFPEIASSLEEGFHKLVCDREETLTKVDFRLPRALERSFESAVRTVFERSCFRVSDPLEKFLDLVRIQLHFDLAGEFEKLLEDKVVVVYWGFDHVMEGSETFTIELVQVSDDEWFGKDGTKTQFAVDPVSAHLRVVSFLEVARDLGLLCEVNDEGDYWDSRDLDSLKRAFDATDRLIRVTAEELSRYVRDKSWSESVVFGSCNGKSSSRICQSKLSDFF